MKRPEIDSDNHRLTVEIPSEIYTKVLEIVKGPDKTESELVIQGLQRFLDEFDVFDLKKNEQDRFADLEIS